MTKEQFSWTHLPDQELLETPLSELGLSLEKHPLMKLIQKLTRELEAKKITLRPRVYLSDDWFCADGTTTFAIPFVLLHPRLKKLEELYIGEVEGGDDEWFMRLARHEMGHVLDNAYNLRLSQKRKEIFGDSSKPYPETYEYKAYSKSFVQHIEDGYAQSHPDEDWAETFAVWLTPNSKWKTQYKNWPALKKVEYLNDLFQKKVQNKRPLIDNQSMPYQLKDLKITLREYLEEKRKRLFPKRKPILTPTQKKIFLKRTPSNKLPLASHTIRENRKFFSQVIKRETDQYLYRVNQAMDVLIEDCERLKWTLHPSAAQRPHFLAKVLATQVKSIIQGGHHRIIM